MAARARSKPGKYLVENKSSKKGYKEKGEEKKEAVILKRAGLVHDRFLYFAGLKLRV